MAHLVYFLNPQIDISAIRLAGVTAVYALLSGLIFGTVLWLMHLARVRLSGGEAAGVLHIRGFGFVAAAALVASIVYWGHVLLLRVYLPRGAVRNLSKASSIIVATGVVLFLLWLLERTASRKVGRTLFAAACAIVLLSSFFLHQRRERYRDEPRRPAFGVTESREPRRVVVVAVKNLPFDWLLQLMGEDLLPFFSRVRDDSFLTRVEPFPTTSPKSLWASLITGKLPHAHGVTGRFSYATALNAREQRFLLVPYWVGFKAWGLIPPVERISAQLPAGDALALWSLFQRSGHSAAVVNWPSSEGAEGSAGILVSDRSVQKAVDKDPAEMLTTPDRRAYQMLEPRVRNEVLTAAASDTTAAAMFRRSFAGPAQPTLAVLSLNGLAAAQEALGLEANRLPETSTPAGQAIRSYVEQIDGLLEAIGREVAVADATLIVVSPSGPRPPPLPATPLILATTLLSQEEPGSADGLLMIRGFGAAGRDNPAPAVVTDLVPTTLFAAGLPLARDMDGRAIAEAFDETFVQQNPMSLISSYEGHAE